MQADLNEVQADHARKKKQLVKENEKVKKGQVLVTVVMVKATIDIEAPTDGYIIRILIPNGESFALGSILATFENSD